MLKQNGPFDKTMQPISAMNKSEEGYSYSEVEMQDIYQEIGHDETESDSVGLLDAVDSYDSHSNWGAVSNLDVFFQRLYTYYRERGFACILVKEIINIATRVFVVFFSTFLIGFLDWQKLIMCHDEKSCYAFSTYVIDFSSHSAPFNVFIVLYFILFFIWWLWTLVSLFPKLKNSWDIRQFYFNYLFITTRDLQTMEWSTVVDRLLKLQASGKYRIQITGDKLTAKSILQRVMRKENYLIAMMNHKILPFGSGFCDSKWFLGMHMERMIKLCILDQLFDDRFSLRRDFVTRPLLLRRRLVFYGVWNFILLPFTIVFYLILFFLKYAEEFHSKQNYLGPRWYSPSAMWEFREFNELDHYFESRMAASIRHADAYIKQFPTPVPTAIASGFSFISGSFVAVLLIFTLLDDSILLHVTLFNKNLFWYFAILSGFLALARSFIPAFGESKFKPYSAMYRVVAYTHYLPNSWRDKMHTYDVLDEFTSLYQYKVVLLLREVLCIFSTPFILCFVLTSRVDDIINFIAEHTVYINGVGDVCVFSDLNIEEHGNEAYGGNNKQYASPPMRGMREFCTYNGKLEKSWLNFYTKYGVLSEISDIEFGSSKLLQKLKKFQLEQVNSRKNEFMKMSNESSLTDLNDSFAVEIKRENDMFESTGSLTVPLEKAKLPNSENYFYWLEEYRNSTNR